MTKLKLIQGMIGELTPTQREDLLRNLEHLVRLERLAAKLSDTEADILLKLFKERGKCV
jgi:hypothetical protein